MNIKYLMMPLFFAAAVFATPVFCLASTATAPSSVMVAFITEGANGVDSINVYSATAGFHCVVKARGVFNRGLYGYDVASDTWLLGTPFSPNRNLVKVHEGKRITIRLSQFPDGGKFRHMAFGASNLTVSSVRNGHLVLNTYRLDGSPRETRTLTIGGKIAKEALYVSVARTGFVAADLAMKGSSGSDIYIFDDKGLINDRILFGGQVKFDPDGRRLAYKEWVPANSPPISGYAQTGNIVIYDVATKYKRVIADMPPDAAESHLPLWSRYRWPGTERVSLVSRRTRTGLLLYSRRILGTGILFDRYHVRETRMEESANRVVFGRRFDRNGQYAKAAL